MNTKPDDFETIEAALGMWIQEAFKATMANKLAADQFDAMQLGVRATEQENFGDYQCDAAMKLARQLKMQPRDFAAQIIAYKPWPTCVEKIELAGPGFINFYLNTAWLEKHLQAIQDSPRLGTPEIGKKHTIVIDYSSPNVAKPMHIGHIRSTVIGNALDRIHRFLGYRVVSDNHLGDWGTQFGLLILGYRNYVNQDALKDSPIEELERIYRLSYEQSEKDPAWLEQARQELAKLQKGDSANLALWRQFVELSMAEFNRIYQRLDISFDLTRGESFYNDRLQGIVDLLYKHNLAEVSEGAVIVRLDDEKLPISIVQKKDGAFNYATTDLATVQSRIEEFHPDSIIYVTDERQRLHFQQFFTIARKLGWTTHLNHCWFGLMRLPEGTFSTRQGNVIKLELLLDEAEKRALDIVRQQSPELPPDQQERIAKAVGLGAVKYSDLSQNPQSLVTFSWDKALSLEGNSAPYLQYAYARIASVLDKYKERFPDDRWLDYPIRLSEPLERRLALHLSRFAEAVSAAAAYFRPNMLADYLYNLAQLYSTFYQNLPFLKAESGVRESRLRLCDLAARTLRQGLSLLGIETPERL